MASQPSFSKEIFHIFLSQLSNVQVILMRGSAIFREAGLSGSAGQLVDHPIGHGIIVSVRRCVKNKPAARPQPPLYDRKKLSQFVAMQVLEYIR
jgi:hypothetical protein